MFAYGLDVQQTNMIRTHIDYGNIVLSDNVWIGANSTIIGGITIGKNAVVSAGSVVTKDIPPNTVVGGVPAKVIKTFDDE